jgi:hypothetical protein
LVFRAEWMTPSGRRGERIFMTFRSLVIGCLAVLSWVLAIGAQSARPQPATALTPARQQAAVPAAQVRPAEARPSTIGADEQRAFLKTWCVGCHNQAAAKAGVDSSRKLQMDALDPAHVDRDRKTWELVVRKVRAGQMPPSGSKRPEPAVFDAHITALENELDRTAAVFAPPPGLHRLNRTEYANAIRDLLDLEIDAAKYLPSDDSTAGFDNIAGALGVSSTLVEAYVNAAQKIARLALGYPEDAGLVVYRTKEDTSQDYHIEGLPFGTRGGMLVPHVFPSDGEYTVTVTPIFGDNMSPTGFGSVPCEKLEILLDGELLGLLNWQGGGRNAGGNCTGRGRGAGPNGQAPQTSAAVIPEPAAPATGGGGGGGFGRGGPPMRVRFKTTAGRHMVGATYLATNFAPLLDLDRHFMRSTVQTGSDARLHVLPACRHHPYRGAVQRHTGEGQRQPPEDLHLHAEDGRGGNRLRAAHCHESGDLRVPPACHASRCQRPDGVLRAGPQREELRNGHRDGARADPLVGAVHLPDRRGAGDAHREHRRLDDPGEPARAGAAHAAHVPAERRRSGIATVVLPLELDS